MKTLSLRRTAAWMVCLWVVLLLAACRTVPAQPLSDALSEPAPDFNRLFQRSNGWTGGDGTLSVLLPDGRTVWLFGDSLLGTVSPGGRRPLDAPFIRNCLVVQKGGELTTLFGGSHGAPSAFFDPADTDRWYWPGHATVEADGLKVFLHRFEATESGLWGWRWIGTDLATLALPSLRITTIAPAPCGNDVMYGAFVLEDASFTYIYGTADRRFPKQAFLARTPSGQVQGPWEYFNGDAWSAAPLASQPILTGVSTQYAVFPVGEDFYLFSMDGRFTFSNVLVAYRARHPAGPWQGPVVVYRAPETDEAVIAYNPFVHSQFSTGRQALVSYNLNHILDPLALYREAAIYRPRFIRVNMAELAQRFEQLSEPAPPPGSNAVGSRRP